MKKITIVIFIVALITLCSCSNQSNLSVDVTTPEPDTPKEAIEYSNNDDSAPESQGFNVSEELPFIYILEPDFDRSNGIYIPDSFYNDKERLAFDLNEFPVELFLSGEWTINDLEKKYGVADEIVGYLEFGDLIVVTVEFKELSIVLHSIRNRNLSFDTNSNPVKTPFPLSEEDKEVKMSIAKIYFSSNKSPLPRGLLIDESTLNQVKAAYPSDAGFEIIQDTHSLLFSYVDFDKIAISSNFSESDTVGLEYRFNNNILISAVLNF